MFARCVSSLKEERVRASKVLPISGKKPSELIKDKQTFLEQVRRALYASKICSYAQGFMLLAAASKEFNWNLNMGAISLMWRGGCIIRSRFLNDIKKAFEKNPQLTNLLLDDFFLKSITECLVSCLEVLNVTFIFLGKLETSCCHCSAIGNSNTRLLCSTFVLWQLPQRGFASKLDPSPTWLLRSSHLRITRPTRHSSHKLDRTRWQRHLKRIWIQGKPII